LRVGLRPTRRGLDDPIDKFGTIEIPVAVNRREPVFCELGRFVEQCLGRAVSEVRVDAMLDSVQETARMFHRK
jgi:hypothetical protein